MKFFLVFLVVCVALAAAAPQLLTWPGYTGITPVASTLVAGPTVVNGLGTRYITPGYVGPTYL